LYKYISDLLAKIGTAWFLIGVGAIMFEKQLQSIHPQEAAIAIVLGIVINLGGFYFAYLSGDE